jgi:copper chaperone CopZ
MQTVTYTVPNISCNHCVHTIKTEIGDMPGVKSVEAWSDSKKVTISFDSPATEEDIIALLTEINYPPEK